MTDQKTDLLPCPFCGGQAELFSGHVACRETGCEMCFSDISDVKFTVAEWNTRADLAPKVKPQKEEVAKLVYRAMQFADECAGGPALDWVERGKSPIQEEARATAATILSALTLAPITLEQAAKVLLKADISKFFGGDEVGYQSYEDAIAALKAIAEDG